MLNQRGLSLVELMISITLGLVLMTGVVQMLVASMTVAGTQQGLSRIQETGRFATEFVGRDLRMAANYGCLNVRDFTSDSAIKYKIFDGTTYVAGNGLHRDMTVGMRGYNASSTLAADKLPNGIATDLGPTTSFTVKAGSDVLVIRGANERGILLQKANPSTATEVYGYTKDGVVANGCVEGFCSGGFAVVSNCANGRVIKLSVAPTVATNKVTLTHADSWDVSATGPVTDKYEDGTIYPVHTIVYFVATSLLPAGNTTPGLWQRVDNGTAVEVLQNVENMSIRYRPAQSGAVPIPAFVTAANVAQWEDINSVEIEFLVRGDNPKNLEEPQPYTFRNVTTTPAAGDQYLRQVFKSTYTLRSKIR